MLMVMTAHTMWRFYFIFSVIQMHYFKRFARCLGGRSKFIKCAFLFIGKIILKQNFFFFFYNV